MASSIDGYAIQIQDGSFSETCGFVGSDVDVWLGTAGHQRQHKAYGAASFWSFVCVEDCESVAWVNSVGNHLATHVTDGAAVAWVVDAGAKHSVPAGQLVYVLGLEIWFGQAMKTRYIKLTVRAA